MWFTSDKTQSYFAQLYDRHGDSYFEDCTEESLKQVFCKISEEVQLIIKHFAYITILSGRVLEFINNLWPYMDMCSYRITDIQSVLWDSPCSMWMFKEFRVGSREWYTIVQAVLGVTANAWKFILSV